MIRFAWFVALGGFACSSAAQTNPAQAGAKSSYCAALARELEHSRAQGRHREAVLDRLMPGAAARLAEPDFASLAAAQSDGAVTTVFARAGTGKTQLAWALEARLCAIQPVVRLTADRDLRGRLASSDASAVLQHLIAEKRALVERTAVGATTPAREPWLLILDGPDELGRAGSAALIEAMRAMGGRDHRMRAIVLRRPSLTHVAGPVHGTAFALRGLDRTQALAAIAEQLAKSVAEAAAASAWLHAHGALRVAAGSADRLAHVRTWQDVATVVDLARAATMAGAQAEDLGQSALLERWIALRLQGLGVPPPQAWRWLDTLYASTAIDGELPTGVWTSADCATAGRLADRDGSRVCTSLVDVGLFRPAAGSGLWRLAFSTLDDHMRTRWMANQHMGCAAVAAEVVGEDARELLVQVLGHPGLSRCAPEVLAAAAQAGAGREALADAIDEALPLDSPVRAAVRP